MHADAHRAVTSMCTNPLALKLRYWIGFTEHGLQLEQLLLARHTSQLCAWTQGRTRCCVRWSGTLQCQVRGSLCCARPRLCLILNPCSDCASLYTVLPHSGFFPGFPEPPAGSRTPTLGQKQKAGMGTSGLGVGPAGAGPRGRKASKAAGGLFATDNSTPR
jgi:hypothetical protein